MRLIYYGQDQDYIAFKDRSPAAEHHILVVPKIHVGEIQILTASLLEDRGMTRTRAHCTASVKVLKQADIPMRKPPANLYHIFSQVSYVVTTMKEIGSRIFDDLGVQPGERKYNPFFESSRSCHLTEILGRFGFHIPPFNSVNHLHLHLLALPCRGIRKFEWPVSKGKGGKTKGFSWFVEVDQVIEILQQGKTVTVFPC
jgi:diadenosine tetraphosphate (Ap4A) HIT family hydrolase